ncbi:MAG TPA: UvrD-helicase domain-containing protein [Micromonosporaceae bacterium]|nr:UvrD-helicase domain-containing protein [Micromonosporaceae bacterium]
MFHADLHIHSKFSRACSKDCDIEHLAWWALRKGLRLLGTGDFTHPAWFDHLRDVLVPAEAGLYALRPDLTATVRRGLPPSVAASTVRFMYSVEISTIYKRDDRTRKVHHLVYMPDAEAVARFNARLGRIGNLGSDGRPILGLDSRDLLEITLEASPDGYLVPAHIWTPWFSALGSKSGFDAIADCYVDLADHIFAVETGLSSDPVMNWRVSSLDRYRLVSNSDAHSLPALGREATLLTANLDYYSVREALRTGDGLHGTVEFFPEEGKYHADGHRACGVNWSPAETDAHGGICTGCGKPVTVGVLSRVDDLADRLEDDVPAGRPAVDHLVQLAEILGEIHGVGPRSRSVTDRVDKLVAALGPELAILRTVPVDDITRVGGETLGEAVRRLRAGEVRRTPGYDGEYGIIRLFAPGELGRAATMFGTATLFDTADTLFDVPEALFEVPARKPAAPRTPRPREPRDVVPPPPPAPPIAPPVSPHEPFEPMLAGMEEVGTGLLDRLDSMQRVAASAPGGPMLIVAGPGTGKTRTLTHRIAYLCADLHVRPEQCLAITFTRRAAEEVAERLSTLLGPAAEDVTVATFHALALSMLREHPTRVGLDAAFRVADETERVEALVEAGAPSAAAARRMLGRSASPDRPLDPGLAAGYAKALRSRDLVDLDELVPLALELLRGAPDLVAAYRRRWEWVFVDEYQDVDPAQYELLGLLCPAEGNLCAIGDPDQAIYSFRGADVSFFLRFAQDFTDARVVRLARNYRSSAPILATAVQAIAPTSLVRGRRLDPARLDAEAPQVGLYPAATVADEADFVVRTIDELVGGLTHRSLDSGRVDGRLTPAGAISFADIAVLYRTDAQAAPIVEALSRGSVPVQKRTHDRLRDRAGVAAIARELRFAGSAGSLTSLTTRVRRAADAIADRLRTPTLDGVDATAAGLNTTDLHLAVDVLTPLAERCGDDLERFLTEIATGADVDALDPRAQAVTLLTLHAAKGLEFPVVFLVGCEEGLLPLHFPGSDGDPDAAVAEERRLFFVGLTRARDRLFVSHVRRRFWRGSESEMRPSRFFDAIDPRLFEHRGDQAPRRPRDQQLRLL